MDLTKYFSETFNAECILTDHALKRITERFVYAELSKLKLLVQAALRNTPLNKWKIDEPTVLIDPRFNFSILCSYYPEENIVKVITFIRGKTPEAYKDCKAIVVSILKEKTDQEVMELNRNKKYRK